MSTFQSYASYYDLLYQEKNYNREAAYVDALIKRYTKQASTVLDLGCGTGKHARALAQLGYLVHGVDVSADMLQHAQQALDKDQFLGAKISFSHGDARSVELKKQFDVVTSLFHVMSYQITNQDVKAFLQTMVKHLKPGGVMIFDFWSGPAILSEKPETRVKIIKHELVNLTRITQPILQPDTNSVVINFTLLAQEQERLETINEAHVMRYFFKPEIIGWLDELGIELLAFEQWLTGDNPGTTARDVCVVGRKR